LKAPCGDHKLYKPEGVKRHWLHSNHILGVPADLDGLLFAEVVKFCCLFLGQAKTFQLDVGCDVVLLGTAGKDDIALVQEVGKHGLRHRDPVSSRDSLEDFILNYLLVELRKR
jgi:hypothetical protein